LREGFTLYGVPWEHGVRIILREDLLVNAGNLTI
jgi:hypothetical protein